MISRQVPDSPAIVLATLNAKYIHASLGLRYLLANMDRHGGAGLPARTQLREFVIQQRREKEKTKEDGGFEALKRSARARSSKWTGSPEPAELNNE